MWKAPLFRLAVVAFALLTALASNGRVSALSFMVNSTTDAVDANPGDGVCADATGACTLRAAVMEANALPQVYTVTLGEGTYLLTIPGRLEDAAATGDLDITKATTITGAGPDKTIVDGGELDRVFETFGFAFSVRIEGLTIKNGNAEFSDGGGIFNFNTISLVLDDVAIVDNKASDFGGGIRSNSFTSTLIISNSVVSGNYAYQGGAAISNLGIATVKATEIIDNHAVLGAGAIDTSGGTSLELVDSVVSGNIGTIGTIFSGGTVDIRNTRVTNNTAAAGGGIYGGGLVTVKESTISSNIATFGEGGGIYYSYGGPGVEGQTVLSVVISMVSSNNSAFEGGGIYTRTPGTIVITNTTIGGNQAGTSEIAREDDKRGGGMFALFGQLHLTNVTITGNKAPVGGGILNNETNNGVGFVELKNTIVSESTNGDCSGSITSAGHNLSSDGSCGLAGAGDLQKVDPKLGELADNGGPTQTHALLAGSPAIDAGDNASCPGTDQRGTARPVDGNSDGVAVCDIGAFEAPAGTTLPTASPTPQATPPPNPAATPEPGSLPAALPRTGGRPS